MTEILQNWLNTGSLVNGLGIGTLGGIISGLLGITAGGILVPALVILLSLNQHQAQGVSLAALLMPTGIPGIIHYHKKGHTISWKMVLLLTGGFLVGSFLGATIAGFIFDRILRWLYIGYLGLLAGLTILRSNYQEQRVELDNFIFNKTKVFLLIAVGIFSGISSGLLGIGGGLAMIVGLVSLMGIPQHMSQALSLAVSVFPAGLPGVWVYLTNDPSFPWGTLIGLIIGLVIGTFLGARLATRLKARQLKFFLLILIVINILLMTWKTIF